MQNPVMEAIYGRRSVRRYQSRRVEKEKIQLMLDAAFHAPSARNLQPWHFTVIEDPALIAELEEGVRRVENSPQMRVFHGAPAVIMVSGHGENHWNQIDCGLATENLLLAAHSLGAWHLYGGIRHAVFEPTGSFGYAREAAPAGGIQPALCRRHWVS